MLRFSRSFHLSMANRLPLQNPARSPRCPPELYALLDGPSIMYIATRNAALEPLSARSRSACSAAADDRELTVFVPAVLAPPIVAEPARQRPDGGDAGPPHRSPRAADQGGLAGRAPHRRRRPRVPDALSRRDAAGDGSGWRAAIDVAAPRLVAERSRCAWRCATCSCRRPARAPGVAASPAARRARPGRS